MVAVREVEDNAAAKVGYTQILAAAVHSLEIGAAVEMLGIGVVGDHRLSRSKRSKLSDLRVAAVKASAKVDKSVEVVALNLASHTPTCAFLVDIRRSDGIGDVGEADM